MTPQMYLVTLWRGCDPQFSNQTEHDDKQKHETKNISNMSSIITMEFHFRMSIVSSEILRTWCLHYFCWPILYWGYSVNAELITEYITFIFNRIKDWLAFSNICISIFWLKKAFSFQLCKAMPGSRQLLTHQKRSGHLPLEPVRSREVRSSCSVSRGPSVGLHVTF